MGWTCSPAREAFPVFATEWDRLNGRFYGGHPMFDSRFIGPMLETFGDGTEQLCVHRTAAAADAALLLRPLGMGRWALFLPAQAQAGAIFLADAGLLETLIQALPGYAWSVDLLALDPSYQPDWSRLRLPRTSIRHALTIAVDIDGTFEAYWQSRPRQLRKNLNRYLRRTGERTNRREVLATTAVDQIGPAVARYAALESKGWKGKAGTAVCAENGQQQFYSRCLGELARSGQARVLELYIEGRLAASRLLIGNDRMWIILKTTFEEALGAEAPGRQLLHDTLEQAFTELHPGGSVEFYTKATRDQADWATSLRYISHSQIYRNGLVAALYGLASGTRSRIARLLSTEPRAGEAFDPTGVAGYEQAPDLPIGAADLFEAAAHGNPECSLDWFTNLQRTVFAEDRGVRYYVSNTHGSTTAVLPVELAGQGMVRQINSLSNYYTSLYTPILAPAAEAVDLADLLQAADRDHDQASVMRFWPMDPESRSYEALLAALRITGWLPFRYFCFGNWYLDVRSTWADYLKQRDGQLRSTIKRMGRKFAAAGGTLEIASQPDSVESATRAFNSVYALSWKKPEPYPEFVPGLIRWLSARGQLRLGIARIHGQPVAAQIWMVGHGKAGIFKLAYDEAYTAYSPGTLLTAHLLEHVIERDRVVEVDYLIGDDRHKQRWMSHRRERWGIVAYNPRTAAGLLLLLREIVGRVARQITRSPGPLGKGGHETMNWTIHPIRDFEQRAPEWDALLHAARGIPFLESAFLRPLLHEFGTGTEVLALAQQGSALRAAAILQKVKPGLWQTFQPSQLPLGAWISAANVDVQEASGSLIQALPGLGIAVGITQLDPMLNPRPEDARCVRTMDYIETAWVDIDQPFDDYWEARGKNLKVNTRKQRAKLVSESTEATLECLRDPAQVAAAIDHYGRLESSGWKGKDGTAVHLDNAQGRFYRQMLENYCAMGRGRIYSYRFNDKVVAMDLCIEADDRIVILKTAYDESYKSISPSTLMRQDEFRELFAEGKLKRIEFYGKRMEWHSRWTDKARTLYHLTHYRWAVFDSLHSRYRKLRHKGAAAQRQEPSAD